MPEIKLAANAKLNLTLDITGVRQDGYHLMDMVNRSVDLRDEVTIKTARRGDIYIRSNARFLPRGEKNLAFKAAKLLEAYTGKPLPSLDIFIKKRIPSKAGLGGGSADAAAVLAGLNRMLNLGLAEDELCAVGEKVGADVPFCIVGGAARVQGIGELITPVRDECDYHLVILMPREGTSTKEAFALYDSGKAFAHPDTEGILAAMNKGDSPEVALRVKNVFNELEESGLSSLLISQLLRAGALGASMTGTGAAVFGIFSDRLSAQRCRDRLSSANVRAYTSRPCQNGVDVLFESR